MTRLTKNTLQGMFAELQTMMDDMAELEKRVARMTEEEFRQYLQTECLYQLVRKLDDGTWIAYPTSK